MAVVPEASTPANITTILTIDTALVAVIEAMMLVVAHVLKEMCSVALSSS